MRKPDEGNTAISRHFDRGPTPELLVEHDLHEVCADAISAASHCKLDFDAVQGIQLDADRAISLALIINELVTNAAKYAFPNRSDGHIWVRLARQNENTAFISVRDDGVGLPASSTSARAVDWGCGSSRDFQNNWGLPSAIVGISMGLSSY